MRALRLRLQAGTAFHRQRKNQHHRGILLHMKIAFKKMSGAGNDFIVVDNRDYNLSDLVAVTHKVCDRTNAFGGADGFIAIEPSAKAEFEMKYFNADGST